MMTNLFSIFDPASSFSLPLNWLSTSLGLLFLPYSYWVLPNRFTVLFNLITSTLHKEFKVLLGADYKKGHTFIFITLFVFIMFNNLLGLLPYVFTSTSHLSMTLTLALPLWLSFMFFGWINHTKHMLAHLVPLGTPGALMPFMVLIETISNVIRPGTLAVRLAANMIAGHLLLVLLGNQGPNVSSSILTLLIITQILLLTLESAVAVIQSYVFAVLATLYSSEV
uniref:ATP synthase subunit a n=1 Tax=Diaphanosoma excisum TaxID=2094052 RepID=A0A8A1RX95_9CRUS|nr:ATP synthase F0 subunit 6 [Diaphanosoma excisum]QST19916.1 ATP synthase F0 subunit 6 [Diaphanosoma excisum]